MLSESYIDKGCRVLVVDRSMETRELFAQLLRVMGYEVKTAETGMEGLNYAANFLPSVVFSAIGLADQSGFQFCASLRNMPETEDILIVAITGHLEPSCIQLADEAGFDLYLIKPVSIETLLQTLEVVDDRHDKLNSNL